MLIRYGLPYPASSQLADLQPTLNMLSLEVWEAIIPVVEKLLVDHNDNAYRRFFQRIEDALTYEMAYADYDHSDFQTGRWYFSNLSNIQSQFSEVWMIVEKIFLHFRHTDLFRQRYSRIHMVEIYTDLTLVYVDTDDIIAEVWNIQHRGSYERLVISAPTSNHYSY